MSNNFQPIKLNIQGAQAHRAMYDGREHVVAPMVMIKEGVLNGELITAAEIGDFFWVWSGRPVVINHPTDEAGNYISANDPEILAAAPGLIFNPQFDGSSLHAEMWLDVAKVTALGGDALDLMSRIESGSMVEVSTGYFRDLIEASGEFNGQPYQAVAQNLHPDHLALLPSAQGACSIYDGCGVPRVNQQDFTDSVMVAFYPSADVAQQLAMPADSLPAGSIPTNPNDLHLTLAYLGSIADVQTLQNRLLDRLNLFAQGAPLLRAHTAGIGKFYSDSDSEPLIALIEADYLQEWRRELLWYLEDDVEISRRWSFLPHITLAYVPKNTPLEIDVSQSIPLIFDRVALSWGNQTTTFKLQGDVMDESVIVADQQDDDQKRFAPVEYIKNIFKSLKGANTMKDKDKLIKNLVTNGCSLPEDTLKAMDDDTLKALDSDYQPADSEPDVPTQSAPSESPEPDAQPTESAQPDPKKAKKDDDEGEELTLESIMTVVKDVQKQVGDLSKQVTANDDAQRASLIEQIAGNQDIFTAEDLAEKTLPDLQKLAQLTLPPTANFAGATYVGIKANKGKGSGKRAYKKPDVTQAQQ